MSKIADENRLEILNRHGFDETQEFDERQALSKLEIEDMKEIVDFQSHGMSHPFLPRCSTERARQEIFQSKEDLENKYGLKIYALSYPNGDYSDREISIAKKTGYNCAITVDVGFNSNNTDLFRLKRISMNDDADASELLVKASGLWAYIKNMFAGKSHGYLKSDELDWRQEETK
jgi:peptidoglycan/xylan/chitin deacetylase (PgdA/CDA1 family)